MLLAAAVLLLAGCTITKEPQVSEVIQTTGVVRLNFNEAMLQNARFDEYTTHGTATRQCQQMGLPPPLRTVSRSVPVAYSAVHCALMKRSPCNTSVRGWRCRLPPPAIIDLYHLRYYAGGAYL